MAITELIGVLGCALLLAAMSAAVLGGGNGETTARRSLEDGAQIREIHGAMAIFAAEHEERMPRPGLIDRLPVEVDGVLRDVPGRGESDPAQDTTANLYSTLICMRYITPESVVSPIERNPRVRVCREFDWDAYDPGRDVYWDPAFVADLANESNTSYAHLVTYGDRLERGWRSASGYPHLGDRGPAAGEPDADSFTCGPHGHWAGYIAFADGHVEMLTDVRSKTLVVASADRSRPDNIFAMETGADGGDAVISFTLEVKPGGPVLQND
jgi:prepilin-type processing-associated H-X9-DG protein